MFQGLRWVFWAGLMSVPESYPNWRVKALVRLWLGVALLRIRKPFFRIAKIEGPGDKE
jgi:hypothetical protein